jgi:membrane-associated phospholipid phosphatase
VRPSELFLAAVEPARESTFVAWFPAVTLNDWREALDHAIQSFPSAHAATAVGLACGMTAVYPHARWVFALAAMMAALQRLVTGAHYPSDVLAGAAIGCLAGALLWRRPYRDFDD